MKHSTTFKKYVVDFRKQHPQMLWSDVAQAVNFQHNTNLSANAIEHIYRAYVAEAVDDVGQPLRYSSVRELPAGNIAIAGDLHAPFIQKGYLEWFLETAKRYNCTTFVLIGDILDQHANSRHVSNAGGDSSGHEFVKAKKQLQSWMTAVPDAFICIGNHDSIYHRQGEAIGLSPYYLKTYEELLNCPPGWQWALAWQLGNVLIEHGTKSSGVSGALSRAISFGCNVVNGHSHTVAGVNYHKQLNQLIWGMSVGCAVDEHAYGFQYAREHKAKYITSMGVVQFDNAGHALPLVIPRH